MNNYFPSCSIKPQHLFKMDKYYFHRDRSRLFAIFATGERIELYSSDNRKVYHVMHDKNDDWVRITKLRFYTILYGWDNPNVDEVGAPGGTCISACTE